MILLDTHVVVWLSLEPDRISRPAEAAIAGARKEHGGLAVCDMTLLEIMSAVGKGRILLDFSLEVFLQQIESRFVVLPITARACIIALEFPPSYPKDPADRIIGATAVAEGLSLVTADRNIRRSKALRTIW